MFRSITPKSIVALCTIWMMTTTLLLLPIEGFVVLPPVQHAVAMTNRAVANNPLTVTPAASSSLPFSGTESLLQTHATPVVLSSSTSSEWLLPQVSLATVTLDPTTFLSDVLGGVLGTPVILAIPIAAALAVASLIAYGIIAYASPAESDD